MFAEGCGRAWPGETEGSITVARFHRQGQPGMAGLKDDGSLAGQVGTFVDELKSALAFLTRLPPDWIGADATVRPDFTVGARVFPVAGALIGAAGGAILIAAWLVGIPAWVSAGLAVATTILLTGGLHEDGLADTADSFGGATREQKFAIMDDSRVGTYGALALGISLLVRVAALATIAVHGPLFAALALIAAEAVSRAALVREWHDLPSARSSSLSNDTGPPEYMAMLTALVAALAFLLVAALPALGWRATALAAVLATGGAYVAIRMTADAFGGRTGDTLGACQQVTLAAFLVGASSV
jgi:adenosylcobinamide-GDP ribazoletransferase